MSIEEYNRIATRNITQYSITPKKFRPNPTANDYTRGWIHRYFIRKINDPNARVIEVTSRQYDVFREFTFYLAVQINWNISLPHTLDNDIGAVEFNRKQIRKGMVIIPNLNIYFSNVLEFHKDGGRESVGFLLPEGQRMREDGVIVTEVENKIIGRIIK